MTNEEKALELYPKDIEEFWGPLPGAKEPCRCDKNLQYRIGFMKAAEWKDVSIKQYLQHGKEFAIEKGNRELAELFEIIIDDLKL